MSSLSVIKSYPDRYQGRGGTRPAAWTREYLRWVAVVDFACATAGTFVAVQLRFGKSVSGAYTALSLVLPLLWLVGLWLAGAYDVRWIGGGSDEFRRVLNAG